MRENIDEDSDEGDEKPMEEHMGRVNDDCENL